MTAPRDRDPLSPEPVLVAHVDAWTAAIGLSVDGDDATARAMVLPAVGPGVSPETWSARLLAGATMLAVATTEAEQDPPGPDERWAIATVGPRPPQAHEHCCLLVVEALMNTDPERASAVADGYIRWGEPGVRARLVALLHYLLAWHTATRTGVPQTLPTPGWGGDDQ